MPLAGPEEVALNGGLMHVHQQRELKLRAVIHARELRIGSPCMSDVAAITEAAAGLLRLHRCG